MKKISLHVKIIHRITFFLIVFSMINVFAQARTINGQTISQTVSWSGIIKITGDVVVSPTGILIIEQGNYP